MFGRKKQQSRRLTGVSATLTADHRDQTSGVVHGHTWEITAWFRYDGTDHRVLLRVLEQVVGYYQGKCLPDRFAWGELLAEHVAREINCDYGSERCIAVDVARPDVHHIARWEA